MLFRPCSESREKFLRLGDGKEPADACLRAPVAFVTSVLQRPSYLVMPFTWRLHLVFSFLRRARSGITQCLETTCCSRDIPNASQCSAPACELSSLCPCIVRLRAVSFFPSQGGFFSTCSSVSCQGVIWQCFSTNRNRTLRFPCPCDLQRSPGSFAH